MPRLLSQLEQSIKDFTVVTEVSHGEPMVGVLFLNVEAKQAKDKKKKGIRYL